MPFETGVVGTGPHRKEEKRKILNPPQRQASCRARQQFIAPGIKETARERGRRKKPRRSAARADANGRLQVAPSWPDHEVFDLFAATSRNTEKVQEGNQAAGPAAAML